MTPPPSAAELERTERLLAQSGWVRALARKLVRDPHRADDLAQEACLAAIRDGPRPEGLRAWIAAVLRNLVREDTRSAAHRALRERASARPEATGSTLELLERLSVHQKVVDTVARLEEPYRSAILLRYFEGLTPSAIARRQGVPVSTVKTRLQRALEHLRVRLDGERGPGGRSWLAALVPLTWKSGGVSAATPPILGALFVSTQLKLAAAAVAAVAIGVGALALFEPRTPEPERPANAAAPAETEPALAAAPARSLGAPQMLPERRDVPVPEAPVRAAPASAPAPPPPAPLVGLVVDLAGRALPGEAVRFEGALVGRPDEPDADGEARAVSGPDGRFVFEHAGRGRLSAGGAGRATVFAASARLDRGGAEPVLVVADAHPLGGRVLDERGRPLAGARVELALPAGLRAGLGRVLDSSEQLAWVAASDADGRFALEQAPYVEGALLEAQLEGYERWSEPEPTLPGRALTLVLRRPAAVLEHSLSGLVVDPEGRAVPGASVSFGLESTRTDEAGLFTFDLQDEQSMNALAARRFGAPPARRLIAFKEGLCPARLEARARPREPPARTGLRRADPRRSAAVDRGTGGRRGGESAPGDAGLDRGREPVRRDARGPHRAREHARRKA